MAAVAVSVAALRSSCQTPISVVGVGLLVLRRYEGASIDAGSGTWRCAVGSRPGQTIQIIVAELLGICLPRDGGLYAHDIVSGIIGRLRLVPCRAVVGQRGGSQTDTCVIAGGKAV